MREFLVAFLLLIAASLLTIGAGLLYFPAGVITAGCSVAAWTIVVFAEVGE